MPGSHPRPRLAVLQQDAHGGAAAASEHGATPLIPRTTASPDGAHRLLLAIAPHCGIAQLRDDDVDGILHVAGDVGGDAAERERFLTALFAFARLREVEQRGERSGLVAYHAAHKYLLLAHDEPGMRELGRIVGAVAERPWQETVQLYRARLHEAFVRPASTGGHVNALTHAFGHLSGSLSTAERRLFVQVLHDVAEGRSSVHSALLLLRSWVIRFDVPYLAQQAYFEPYPSVELPA